MLHDIRPIPLWAIVLIVIVITIPTFVLITGRNADGGLKGRASHGWSRWKELSQKAADFQARILLTVFYFTLMAPFGVMAMALGARPTGMAGPAAPVAVVIRCTVASPLSAT